MVSPIGFDFAEPDAARLSPTVNLCV